MMMQNKELGVITLCHEDIDIFARSVTLYFLNNRFHDNKTYYWVMHNCCKDILDAAYRFADLLKPIQINVVKVKNEWVYSAGGNLGIYNLIIDTDIDYWQKIDQDIFHVTENTTDDLFGKCKILHGLHKTNFGFITPLINLNVAMTPILLEKLGWATPEDLADNFQKHNIDNFITCPWWQTDFQEYIWNNTHSLLEQAEKFKDGEITNPPLDKVQLSIGNIMFHKYSFRKMNSLLTPEPSWWITFTNKGIFIDTSHFVGHYSYFNGRHIINEKYRTKIFNLLDEVIQERLKKHPSFESVILEINKKIPTHILYNEL